MVALAPAKVVLAFPVLLFLVALALVLTARTVAAPSQVVMPLPVIVHTAISPQASSAASADHGSSSGTSSAAQQPRPYTRPPSSKVKTGDGADRASSCTSLHCPR